MCHGPKGCNVRESLVRRSLAEIRLFEKVSGLHLARICEGKVSLTKAAGSCWMTDAFLKEGCRVVGARSPLYGTCTTGALLVALGPSYIRMCDHPTVMVLSWLPYLYFT